MKSSTRRLLSFVIACLFLFVALIVFLNFLRPAYHEAQVLKGQRVSLQNFISNQEATIAQVERVIKEYEGSQNPKEVVTMALPRAKNEAELLNQLSVLADKNALAIQNVNVNPPGSRAASRTGVSSSTLVKPLNVISVQMRVAGSYLAFKSFLSAIETNLRIMDVGGIAVQPVGRSNQDFYNFDITVQSYYQNP